MVETLSILSVGLGALATLTTLVILAKLWWGKAPFGDVAALIRSEVESLRQAGDGQARVGRQELADNMRGLQETILNAFRSLSDGISTQTRDFGVLLTGGIKTIEDKSRAIGEKLDKDIAQMGKEAQQGREVLRELIAGKLEATTTTQAQSAKDLREEISGNVGRLQETLLKASADQRIAQSEQFDGFTRRLSEALAVLEKRQEGLAKTLEAKLSEFREANNASATALRTEIAESIERLAKALSETAGLSAATQKERLDGVTAALAELSHKNEQSQEAMRQTLAANLETIRLENTAKLEEMRTTVDEKLQKTLDTRLGESFNRVVEQLERVHKGIGEMQTLAAGVGDLKRVLSNVKIRGTFGEVQLSALLEQILSQEQYIQNARVSESSGEYVEFAIRLPGRGDDGPVLLPIDAKFPQDDYQRLVAASEVGDSEAVADASRAMEQRIKTFAKMVQEKYVHPPKTTDFAILFLPTEGLYAEVLRRPGLFECLQRDYRITLTGPTTLAALLNALQMGFRSLAIEKRSSEVWQILGAVRGEFNKYGEVVDHLARQLSTAAKSVEKLGTRTRSMNRKLKDVESLPDGEGAALLGLDDESISIESTASQEDTTLEPSETAA